LPELAGTLDTHALRQLHPLGDGLARLLDVGAERALAGIDEDVADQPAIFAPDTMPAIRWLNAPRSAR
jgi:hypothetical protein